MKNTGEIYKALLDGEKLAKGRGLQIEFVHLVNGILLDHNNDVAHFGFSRPDEWEIWQDEWGPKYQPIYTDINTIYRKDEGTAIRDAKAWESAIKLESFVREFAPYFVPGWCGRYMFLTHDEGDGWTCFESTHDEPGRVPFPLDSGIANKAVNMLTAGTLKL